MEENQPLSIENLTYADLGARLNISAAAARSLARRLQLPRVLSGDGQALVSVDLAEVRHTPHQPARGQAGDVARLTLAVAALQGDMVQLEATAAGHRADFEHERSRADRRMAEMLQATAEAAAAREAAARLEGEVSALRTAVRAGSSEENHGQSSVRRVGSLAASLVEADRKASRG